MSIRVVILRFTSSPATAMTPGARHVAEDEAAVVRGARSPAAAAASYARAGCPCGTPAASGRGGIGTDRGSRRRVAIDDHERVRARDDGVRRVRDAARDRLDRPHDDLDRHQRPDRVVDDHDVVIGRVEAQQAVQGALVAGPATGDDRWREGQPRSAMTASVSDTQSGCATMTSRSIPAAATLAGCAAGSARRRGGRTAWASPRRSGCRRRRPGGWRGSASVALASDSLWLIASELTPDVTVGRRRRWPAGGSRPRVAPARPRVSSPAERKGHCRIRPDRTPASTCRASTSSRSPGNASSGSWRHGRMRGRTRWRSGSATRPTGLTGPTGWGQWRWRRPAGRWRATGFACGST